MTGRHGARLGRRRFLCAAAGGAVGLGFGAGLGGCSRSAAAPSFRELMAGAEGLTERVQRALLWRGGLAREYSAADVSKYFKPNGSQDAYNLPPSYKRLADGGFADWRLKLDGLVEKPLSLSLAQLRGLPARTQITRHDCVEGWSCIGGWTGPRLSTLLELAGLRPEARFVVFHCADELPLYLDGKDLYYESVDLVDAFHPQTILAYELNGAALTIAHGAPLRLRVERQLGYKMAKFVTRIEAVSSFARLQGGHGGYWEDEGYQWYAGI